MTPLSEHPIGSGGAHARKYVLDNGLGVILVADRAAPVCAYQTWFRVGSRDERPGKTGLAHLFEHLMFNETETMAPGEFDRRLEALGADTNAATWFDWTYYRENVPSAHLATVMALEAERMSRLVLHEPQLESERHVVMNERKQVVDDDVDGFLGEQLYKLAFDRHPYRWPTIGWMEDIAALSLEDARSFYKTFYAPNNATVVIVGDLDEQRALDDLGRAYGHLVPQALARPEAQPEPPQQDERRAVFTKQVLTDRLFIGWHGLGLADPDHAALDVIAELLFNGQSSRLYRELVVEGELCSTLTAHVPPFRDPGLFEVCASLQRGHRAAEVEEIIYRELVRLVVEPVAEAQLDKVKNRLEARLWHSLRPHEGKAEGLGHHETTAGDYGLLFEAATRVRAVTAEAVKRVASDCFAARRRCVTIAEPGRGPRAGKKSGAA